MIDNCDFQLIKNHDKREFVFLISLMSGENLVEMADIYLELSTRLQHINQVTKIWDVMMSIIVMLQNFQASLDCRYCLNGILCLVQFVLENRGLPVQTSQGLLRLLILKDLSLKLALLILFNAACAICYIAIIK